MAGRHTRAYLAISGPPIDRQTKRSSEAASVFVSSIDLLCRKLDLTRGDHHE
jgi:hypothetical protein